MCLVITHALPDLHLRSSMLCGPTVSTPQRSLFTWRQCVSRQVQGNTRRGRPVPRAAVRTEASFAHGRRWWRDFEEPKPHDEQVITVLAADGTITNFPSLPHKLQQLERLSLRKTRGPLPTPAEQGLCIGQLFTICATNGYDVQRRVNFFGFCQSTELLFETVEDAVVFRGGEILESERQLKSGVQECLRMMVALPMLWGVPPEMQRLERGIKAGGGIIDKVHKEWHIY